MLNVTAFCGGAKSFLVGKSPAPWLDFFRSTYSGVLPRNELGRKLSVPRSFEKDPLGMAIKLGEWTKPCCFILLWPFLNFSKWRYLRVLEKNGLFSCLTAHVYGSRHTLPGRITFTVTPNLGPVALLLGRRHTRATAGFPCHFTFDFVVYGHCCNRQNQLILGLY